MPASDLHCARCNRRPNEIPEYVEAARMEQETPDEFVSLEEGTFNPLTGRFWCSDCYIKLGQPLGAAS